MPAYYDSNKKSWYCKFYYTDWQGIRRQKMKRGFKLKREARDWEQNFLLQQAGSPDMTFGALWELYFSDCEKRLKRSTCRTRSAIYKNHIAPYWKDMPLNQITPAAIRQ